MLQAGLVSVTFRALPPEEIVKLVAKAGLEGIEWGGDVHVPPGDTAIAEHVRAITVDAGLQVAAYGSYFRAGEDDAKVRHAVLHTALLLQAPTIRIWAGRRGSANADASYRQKVVADSRALADEAAAEGITVSFEFHPNTLTDTLDSTLTLLDEVNSNNIYTYWQPPGDIDFPSRLAGLEAVFPRLSNVHVMHHVPGKGRLPLADASDDWLNYLRPVAKSANKHWAMIEFVPDNSPDIFQDEARTLLSWVDKIQAELNAGD